MKTEKAVFAAGCFWGVEEYFSGIKGVISAVSGYTGGITENPTYKEVCTGLTNHAEAVEVEFDSDVITYNDLLQLFFKMHDPTTLNRQGPDSGTQYRSAIFCISEKQKSTAELYKTELNDSPEFLGRIVTEITEASEFYRAEEYHQKYFKKNPGHSCRIV